MSRTGKYKPSIAFGYATWLAGQAILATMTERTKDATIYGASILAACGSGSVYQT